jgi:hypothetical protein
MSIDDIKDIRQIICKICDRKQEFRRKCKYCEIDFGEYYCNKCKIIENNRDIYHCNKCGHCINGMKKDFIHCKECDLCVKKNIKHKCIKDRNDRQCSICMEELDKKTNVVSMICGHSIHEECLKFHLKSSYKCPECMKTIKDMREEFKKIDDEIENEPLSDELSYDVKIFCNDCEETTITQYHYLGTKCLKCKSYNTTKT